MVKTLPDPIHWQNHDFTNVRAGQPSCGPDVDCRASGIHHASSVLVLGTGNRLARVVDRTRYIAQQLRNEHDRALCQMYSTQLERLEKRGQKLVGGMTFFYTAVGSFAAASLVSLLGAMLAETRPDTLVV